MTFKIPQRTIDALISKGTFPVTDITYEVIQRIISWILENRPGRTKFTLLINSDGGSPSSITYLASFLKTLPEGVQLKGVAFGECGSAALALLQCCDERIAVEHCGFFVHHAIRKLEISSHEPDVQRLKLELAQTAAVEGELVALQVKRSGRSRASWMQLAAAGDKVPGRAIFPAEARKLGLIDRIMKRYPVF